MGWVGLAVWGGGGRQQQVSLVCFGCWGLSQRDYFLGGGEVGSAICVCHLPALGAGGGP